MRCSVFVACLFLGFFAQAQETNEVSKSITEMGPVKVIGSSQEELSKPNSAHFVDKAKLEQQQQTDVTRVLKQVPGVYVQEEDGFGLRPNIGLRGTHPHRSRKVVLLEDGILIGPAPYSAPAAYYTPFMSKIESLEIFKGVASVNYGPNSIGGAINYLTRSIPKKSRSEIDLAAGMYNTQKYRGNVAHIWETGGIMLEGTHLQTDGFKKLDSGHDTGFKKNDILLKGDLRLGGSAQHEIQWKVGYADELSDETYLGLTRDDFFNSPYRRYAGSERDLMDFDHQQYQLTYKNQLQDNWAVWATGYRNNFHRNWSRFNNFRSATLNVSDVLKNPGKDAANQLAYDVLRGEADSAPGDANNLVLANNDRYFHSQGLQLNSYSFHTTGSLEHQVSIGIRLHEDQIRRNHSEDFFAMESKRMVSAGDPRRQTANNTAVSQALTVSVGDEILWNKWKFTAVSRFENVNYEYEKRPDDISATASTETTSESVFVPGAGALYQFNDQWSALVGVNKGVTLVGPGQSQSEKPEESINYETGVRYSNVDQQLFAEGIVFVADYSNIKGTCSFSSGCTGSTLDQEFDGGKAKIQGVEARASKGFQWKNIHIPVSMSATFTKAEFASSSTSSNPEWGNGDIHPGDPLPYVPNAQYSLGVGTEYKKYIQEIVFTWTGKMYDQTVSTDREDIPAYGVIDWTAKYQYDKTGQVYARLDNLLDNEYLVSLRPFGARPGKARSVMVGVKHIF
ncbi:Fe(3+) dicitrate transport protein FecA precursor [compost metagenome]